MGLVAGGHEVSGDLAARKGEKEAIMKCAGGAALWWQRKQGES